VVAGKGGRKREGPCLRRQSGSSGVPRRGRGESWRLLPENENVVNVKRMTGGILDLDVAVGGDQGTWGGGGRHTAPEAEASQMGDYAMAERAFKSD